MKRLIVRIATVSGLLILLSCLPLAVSYAAGSVSFRLEPSATTVTAGDIFTVVIRVDASAQEIDAVEAYVNFDPAFLRVVDTGDFVIASEADNIITPGPITTTRLTQRLLNKVKNNQGYADIAYGISPGSAPVKENFILGTIRFKAMAETSGAVLIFNAVLPRSTTAARGGTDVTGTRQNITVAIQRASQPAPPPATTPPSTQNGNLPPPDAKTTGALAITITAPLDGMTTGNPSQVIEGTVSDRTITTATLMLNGKSRTIGIADGAFGQAITLTSGLNTVSVTTTDNQGNTATAQVIIRLVSSPATEPSPSQQPASPASTGTPGTTTATSPAGEKQQSTTTQSSSTNWPLVAGAVGGAIVVVGGLLIFLAVKGIL